jgi:cytidylate kinase
MAVITISRQLGSLGCDIAHTVADQLGYRIVWRELINEAARQAGAPQVALAVIDELDIFGLTPSAKEYRAYRNAVQQVMERLASEGDVVIVGRAGQAILRGRPDVLHVRICAPAHIRAERLAARQGITIEGAIAQVEASDKSRRNYLKRFYRANWDNLSLYDVIINTERLSSEAAASLIIQALKSYAPISTSSQPGQETAFEPR